jgi:hypothetical protein
MNELLETFSNTIKINNFEQLLWTLIFVSILYVVWNVNKKIAKFIKKFQKDTISKLFKDNYKHINEVLIDLKKKYKPDRIHIVQFFNGTEYVSEKQRMHFEVTHVFGEIDRNKDCNKQFICSLYHYGFFEYFTEFIKSASENCWELLHIANIQTGSELENLYLFNINKEHKDSFNINLNYQGIKHMLARAIYTNNGALIAILALEYLTPIKLNDELTNIIINGDSYPIIDINKHLTDKILKIKKYL